MLAFVGAKVDVGHCALEKREHRLLDAGCIADEGEYGPVVRRVGGEIEQPHARDPPDRVGERSDHFLAPSLADVRDAFD